MAMTTDIILDVQKAITALECVGEVPDTLILSERLYHRWRGYKMREGRKGNSHQRRVNRRFETRFRNYFQKVVDL